MALHTEKPILKTTLVAVGAITKRRFVRPTGAQCNAIGQYAVGVSGESDQDTGKTFEATILGTALVEAAEGLVVEDKVMTDGAGKARKAQGANRYVAGTVMRSQPTPGQLVEIFLSSAKLESTATTTTTTTTSTTSTTTTTTA